MDPNDNIGSGDNGSDTAKFGGKHHRTSSGSGGPNLALIATAVIVAFCVIFFVKNNHETSIEFVFFTKTTTMRWLILMAILLGIVIDKCFSIWWRHRRRRLREERD